MRSIAKASSAGSNQRQASGLGRFFRGAFAGRGASSGTDGSGAPATPSARRGRLALLGLAALLFAALTVGGSALANHVAVDYFGTQVGSGALGGELNKPRELSVNNSGAGPADAGDVYVVDDENHRIQRFDSDGDFVSAWGADVVQTGGTGDVGDEVAKAYEVCTVVSECKAGVPSGGNGAASGNGSFNRPQGIAIDEDTGNVYVTDRDNRRINQYGGDGAFVRSIGWNVDATEVGTGYEVCPAANVCQAGVAGAGLGQLGAGGNLGFGSFNNASYLGIAVSPPDGNPATGKVYLANTKNRRVETYDLDGANPANFGSSTVFAANQPRRVAVDSRGIVYASNTTNQGRIERYDSQNANGGGIVFLAPILAKNSSPETGPLLANNAFADRATSGLVVDPDSDGAGPDEDVLYVLRYPANSSLGETSVQQFGPVNDPGLTAAPSEDDEKHGAAGLQIFNEADPIVYGLALDRSSNRFYISSDLNGDHRVYVLDDDPLPLPVPTLDQVTVKTDTTATITGTVDPKGGVGVNCELDYDTGPDLSSATVLSVPDCGGLDPDGGPQPFSQQITGLDPNTTYYFSFTVTRDFDSTSTVTSTTRFFTTVAPPPVISDVGAVQIGDSSARLVATIDPRNTETGYVFEYGTTPALGSSTAPLAIGSGTTPITVSQVIGGLQKDTTYYFRAVATNLSGTTESPSATFRTRAFPPPPNPGRGYEMVSPPDKSFTDVDQGVVKGQVGIAPNGETVGFCTQALFGENPSQMRATCAPYVGHRTASGWLTINPFPEFCPIDSDSGAARFMVTYPAADFNRFIVARPESASCPTPPLDPAAPLTPGAQANNLYLLDPFSDPIDHQLINPGAAGSTADLPAPSGGSDDFSHVVYTSFDNQTPEGDSPPAGDFRKLYESVREGPDCGPASPDYYASRSSCLRLVTKDAAGNPFGTASSIPNLGYFGGQPYVLNSAVSADGKRIFFQNPHFVEFSPRWLAAGCKAEGCQVYLRENGETTLDVSASECTVDCGAPQSTADTFISATPSGADAFFTSCARLTDASSPELSCDEGPWNQSAISGGSGDHGSKLYRWDRDQPDGNRLVDLTADHEPSDGIQPNFRGLIGHSDDGETAYFVAAGQIVAGQPTEAGLKLYRWRWNEGAPQVDYLGPYQVTRGPLSGDYNWGQKHHHVTSNGEHLLIYSALAYDPAGDRDADVDAYRWGEADGFICLSCQLPGAPSSGDVDLTHRAFQSFVGGPPSAMVSTERTRFISEDGQRVFFATADALVPQDTNGEGGCPPAASGVPSCMDVYEWHDGTLNLVSTGTGTSPARLLTVTPSGDDVLFYTRERLVGWDADQNVDIYDARLGGGFPEPAPQPEGCEGEACRGAAAPVPQLTGPATPHFVGPGNPPAGRDCRAAARRAKRLGDRAKRGRRNARRLARVGKRDQAGRLHDRARRLARKARKSSRQAKRCRQGNRRANTNRRAAR